MHVHFFSFFCDKKRKETEPEKRKKNATERQGFTLKPMICLMSRLIKQKSFRESLLEQCLAEKRVFSLFGFKKIYFPPSQLTIDEIKNIAEVSFVTSVGTIMANFKKFVEKADEKKVGIIVKKLDKAICKNKEIIRNENYDGFIDDIRESLNDRISNDPNNEKLKDIQDKLTEISNYQEVTAFSFS